MLGILHGFYCLSSFWVNLWFDPFYEVTISVVTFCLNWNSILFSNKLISNLCIFKLIEIYMILKSIKKLNSNIKRQNKLMWLDKKLNNKKSPLQMKPPSCWKILLLTWFNISNDSSLRNSINLFCYTHILRKIIIWRF